MLKQFKNTVTTVSSLVMVLVLQTAFVSSSVADETVIERGKKAAFDRKAGNCLSCHLIEDGEAPGNIGPPLVAMKARFPDKEKLRDLVWDITASRPEAMMPPFGKHKIISEQDIDDIVEYLYTL